MRDTGLADRLRKRGISVVEIGGWKTRGSDSFAPRGSVNHHTAGAPSGVAPSLSICIYGRPDVPGPLCQVLLGRDLRAYVIAAGRANHAGLGGWNGLTGNSRMHGLEIEHTGYGTSPSQVKVALQIHAAFLEAPGSSGNAAYTCQHFEWAPTRKIDFRDLFPWNARSFRDGVKAALNGPAPTPPPPTPKDWFDMATEADLRKVVREESNKSMLVRATVDGVATGPYYISLPGFSGKYDVYGWNNVAMMVYFGLQHAGSLPGGQFKPFLFPKDFLDQIPTLANTNASKVPGE